MLRTNGKKVISEFLNIATNIPITRIKTAGIAAISGPTTLSMDLKIEYPIPQNIIIIPS